MRRLVCIALALAAADALAQAYPTQPIRITVPFPPVGAAALLPRTLVQKWSEVWGHQGVVDNRPGAGGNLGGAEAARSAPDGYTLFMSTSGIQAINPLLYAKMPLDPNKDLAPVAPLVSLNHVLVVHPSVPAKIVKEFIALAKAEPGALRFGSAGSGTTHAPLGRALQDHDRHEARARAVQGRRPADGRSPRRAGGSRLRRHGHLVGADQGRQADPARDHERQAQPRAAQRADGAGGRRARLRGAHLVRRLGDQGHAAGDQGAHVQGDRQGDGASRPQEDLGRAGRRCRRHAARRDGKAREERDREVGQGRQGRRRNIKVDN